MLDTSDILKAALTTGLATAVLNQGIGYFREYRADQRNSRRVARLLAAQIAVILEDFCLTCANLLSDKQLYDSSDGYAGRARLAIPTLPTFPEGEWNLLVSELVARCLSLRNEIKLCSGHIEFWDDVGYPDCMPQECALQTGLCGYRAWQLAHDIRQKYKLGSFCTDTVSGWNFVSTLKAKHDEALVAIAEKKSHSGDNGS